MRSSKKTYIGYLYWYANFFSKNQEEKNLVWFFEGSIVKLNSSDKYKVPNVGFSEAKKYKDSGIFKNIDKNLSFYFTNSYGLNLIQNIILKIVV